MYDIAIIGAGVIGAMTASVLSKYDVKICLLEKEADVAMGASSANSAIVHAGFDAHEGSLKARFNVLGNQMMADVCRRLGVKFKNNGSLVIGFNEEDEATIKELYARGVTNGVKDLRIIGDEELHTLEPNVSKNAHYALYAPTGSIVCPYELTFAAIGNAMDNGAELKLNFPVTSIDQKDGYYTVNSDKGSVDAKIVINAAGVYSDKIAKMVGDDSFTVTPRRGEYVLLDKALGETVSHTIFRTPSKMGKGILVSPTVDGNLLTGPTSENITDKDDTSTTPAGLGKVMKESLENVDGVRYNQSITSFCGLRAVGSTGDFIINMPKAGFVNLAGIESPGLTSSPAIAEYVVELLTKSGVKLTEKANYLSTRTPLHAFKTMTMDEKNAVIAKDPTYGHIICRCEGITEGEILNALRTEPKPTTLDGVKRRTRAQMGRCQGGFCSPYIVELICNELHIPYEKVTKSGGESLINVGITKTGKEKC